MQLGLFPLELVLLPSERVPLHIFEDRYRELIGECMADETEFGILLDSTSDLRSGVFDTLGSLADLVRSKRAAIRQQS